MTLTAYALGEIFNEPLPPSLLTSGGMDEIDLPYPSDQLEFAVEVLCPKKVVSQFINLLIWFISQVLVKLLVFMADVSCRVSIIEVPVFPTAWFS